MPRFHNIQISTWISPSVINQEKYEMQKVYGGRYQLASFTAQVIHPVPDYMSIDWQLQLANVHHPTTDLHPGGAVISVIEGGPRG